MLINISRKKSGNAANARDNYGNIMENDCLYIAAGLDYKQNGRCLIDQAPQFIKALIELLHCLSNGVLARVGACTPKRTLFKGIYL